MTTTLTDHHRAADDALQAARAAVEAPTWPRRLTAAREAIEALEGAASVLVFPPYPLPLETAVRGDLDEHLRGVQHDQIVDRTVELHGATLDGYPAFAIALRGSVGAARVRSSVTAAAGARGDGARAYIDAELKRWRVSIAAQLVEAGDELAEPAAELLHAVKLAGELDELRGDRKIIEAERAEAERAARIEAAGDLVERLRALPERFLIPVRKGADYRQPRERTTAAALAGELADGQHGGRLGELNVIVIAAEQRRRMGARW